MSIDLPNYVFFIFTPPFLWQLSPKVSLTVSQSEKARNVTVTARSPSVNPRSVTVKSLHIEKTETKTEKKTKREEAAMQSLCPTDEIVKTVLVAM